MEGTIDSREGLEDFIAKLEDYSPTIPDEVTEYFLNKTGFACPDVRVKRLVALAAQKFLFDVTHSAVQYSRIRNQKSTKKPVLTVEDVVQSLKDQGVNVYKPEYYADKSGTPLVMLPPQPAGSTPAPGSMPPPPAPQAPLK